MATLSEERCFNHAGREAVARCTGCRRCYCRECIVEHEDRIVCASCLNRAAARRARRFRRWTPLWRLMQCLLSFFMLWALFYVLGRELLVLPSEFHEVALWAASPWEAE